MPQELEPFHKSVTTYKERHPVQIQILKDVRAWSLANIMAPAGLTIGTLIWGLLTTPQTSAEVTIRSIIVPLLLGFALYLLIAAVRAPFVVIAEQHRQLLALSQDVRLLQRIDLPQKPRIDFQIHEAFIVPSTNAASCFLRVSLHNETGPPVDNPPSEAYSLQIVVKGKTYANTSIIDTEQYDLGVYRQVEDYNHIGYQDVIPQLLARETLFRIYTKAIDLVPGARVYGWIGFAVHYLPTWDTDKEYIGSSVEYDFEHDEEGNQTERIEESAHSVDEYHYIPHTKAVESLTLTVTDAYGQHWPVTKIGPFSVQDRAILKKNEIVT